MGILTKFFGDANEKYLKKLQPIVEEINRLESEFEKFSNERLRSKTNELKGELDKGRASDDLLPEAFAAVREASKRTLGQRHFDVQLIGGIVLHQGKIAEMKTGEGKTLSATLPLYLNALEGKGCHLVTVNDYLAKRDTIWMGQIYHALGLSVGCIVHDAAFLYDPTAKVAELRSSSALADARAKDEERDTLGGFKVIEDYLRPCLRKEAYQADITYGTNNEFGFDYLRDNMVYPVKSSQGEVNRMNDLQAQRGLHYAIVDEVDSILIDEARTPLIISAPDTESSKWYQDFSRIILRLDSKTDYEVDEKMRAVILTEAGINKVEKILGIGNIYEEKGIKYVHHLEQGLRAEVLFKKDRDYIVKDGEVVIIDEFTGRLMPGRRWSGGLHQAVEAKEGVKVQPESLTLASITFQNLFRAYKKLAGMTGTAVTSAEEFDKVYGLEVIVVPTNKPLIRQDLPDKIYKTKDGKFKALAREVKERHQKGQPILIGTGGFTIGQYTIGAIEKNRIVKGFLEREGITCQVLDATNHQKEGEIIAQAGRLGQVTIATNMAGRGVDIILGGNPPDQEEAEKVKKLGGLHVIGIERHEARRIDNQLQGRTGRQGDSGSSQFFVSLEDDLMRIFGGDRIKSMMGFLKIPEDQPIEASMISGAIESAQAKIEGMNFDVRKHLLDYDDVLNKHREVIYKKRREFLEISDFRFQIKDWLKTPEEEKSLEEKVKELGDNFNQVAKFIALRTLDMLWMEHLEAMEHLRDSVRLRAYGQKDPLVEYKNEGHKMFQNLLESFGSMVINTLFRAQLQPTASPLIHADKYADSRRFNQPVKNKVGRNDPCPCGSNKKYKKCHGA